MPSEIMEKRPDHDGSRDCRAYLHPTQISRLETQIKYNFLPQSVPAYSANAYFSQLQKKFPDYSYREATLNPTNPVNRATDWKRILLRSSASRETKRKLWRARHAERASPVYGSPDEDCQPRLSSVPRHGGRRSKTMTERYGAANGFGWKLNDILTAQIVSVPTQLANQRARGVFQHIHDFAGGCFRRARRGHQCAADFPVIRPVNQLSAMAAM